MQKSSLRPLRLMHLNKYEWENNDHTRKDSENENIGDAENWAGSMRHHTSAPTETRGMPITTSSQHSEAQQVQRDSEAQRFLKHTPNNYLFSQAYGLWLYLTTFVLSLILTHTVTTTEYGIYAAIMTVANTIVYIVALGLEDALVTFVPRLSVEHGKAAGAHLIRRILLFRVMVLAGCACIVLFGLPALAGLVNLLPIQGAKSASVSLQDPILLGHTTPIVLYVLGTSIANLLQTVCAAQMRMIRVFIVGSLTQFCLMLFGFVFLYLGWRIDGVLWIHAIIAMLAAGIFLIWLAPLLLAHKKADNKQPLRPVLHIGFSAWLTNLASGALFKQISITLLSIYAIKLAEIGYFNLAFQLADAANLLLVSGFAGVGASALAASFVGNNYERLGRSWQSLIQAETLLAVPGLVFCLFNAQSLAIALYGIKFAPAGSLLAIFLIFNIFFRVIGTTIHQASLYVIGKPYAVVISQWVSLLLIIVIGIFLVPRFGPAGALIADGIAKALTGVFMLGFLLMKLPRKYPLGLLSFTLRFLLAITIAAIPGLFWHPAGLLQLILSGVGFMALCFGVLLVIKPLSGEDLEMIAGMKPGLARYMRFFAQK